MPVSSPVDGTRKSDEHGCDDDRYGDTPPDESCPSARAGEDDQPRREPQAGGESESLVHDHERLVGEPSRTLRGIRDHGEGHPRQPVAGETDRSGDDERGCGEDSEPVRDHARVSAVAARLAEHARWRGA